MNTNNTNNINQNVNIEKIINELKEKNYIEKVKTKKGELIYITSKGKIYLARNDLNNISFDILKLEKETIEYKGKEYENEYVLIKAKIILKNGRTSEAIAKENKIQITKGEIQFNPKFIEKAQSVALGKALFYIGYGIEIGNLYEEDEEIEEDVNVKEKEENNKTEKVYYSEISGEKINEKIANYSTYKYGIKLTFDEQKFINEKMEEGYSLEEAIKLLKEKQLHKVYGE